MKNQFKLIIIGLLSKHVDVLMASN